MILTVFFNGTFVNNEVRSSKINMWSNVFKNGSSKICGRKPLKVLQTISIQINKRLSSTNFTWSVLEYFVPCIHHFHGLRKYSTNFRDCAK